MAVHIESRQFRSGDEEKINELYFKVTGRERTVEQYRWQWHEAPGGPGDIWLIYAIEEGAEKLIGHHGVMPIRFTCRDQDLLFGKIENTMVLPDYRDKIIYPRFELRFKEQYQQRYHALFATMGPAAAIRVRKASGYKFPAKWQSFRIPTSRINDAVCTIALAKTFLAKRLIKRELTTQKVATLADRINVNRMIDAGFLTDADASKSVFFEEFWAKARKNFGVTPRRDTADLEWRFWRNPYKEHFTFITESSDRNAAYAIVSIRADEPNVAFLEDYAVENPSVFSYTFLFSELLAALSRARLRSLSVITSDDPSLQPSTAFFKRHQICSQKIFSRLRKTTDSKMPRFITEQGSKSEIQCHDWAITGLVLEGRT